MNINDTQLPRESQQRNRTCTRVQNPQVEQERNKTEAAPVAVELIKELQMCLKFSMTVKITGHDVAKHLFYHFNI